MNTIDRPAGPRILIISHDVVGRRMAGPGIRAWQLARVLAAHGAVTLIAPRPIDMTPAEFACGAYAWGDAASLAGWLNAADVVVANGYLLEAHPELAALNQPLALDLYDPVLLENLELLRSAPAAERAERAAADQQLLARQLAAGDFFVCATERQRDLYLGALMLAGRLSPAQLDADPTARDLIDVAPFGLDPAPPVAQAAALRGVLPGVGTDDPLLLWTGGLWDWLDPLTLIDALPQLLARHPHTRLVFLAGRHPGVAAAMRMPDQARAMAEARGLLDRNVFFYDEWVPYERRADFLLEATIAVSLHRNHLETAYAAVRSRFLDHLWAGLPSLVSDGDAAAELVRAHGLGAVVPPGDAAATATALDALLASPAELAACAARARDLAHQFAWERVLQPLVRWVQLAARGEIVQRARVPMSELPAPDPTGLAPEFGALAEIIRQAEALWQIGAAEPDAALAAPRRALLGAAQQAAARMNPQQIRFNAVLVHALYWVTTEAQRSEAQHQAAAAAIRDLAHQNSELRRMLQTSLEHLNNRMVDEERASTLLAQALNRAEVEDDPCA